MKTSLLPQWFTLWKWLHYDEEHDLAFCFIYGNDHRVTVFGNLNQRIVQQNSVLVYDNKFVLAKMCAFIAQKALKVTSESINFAKFAGGACP